MAIVGTTFSVVGLNVVSISVVVFAVVVVGLAVVVLETTCVVASFVAVLTVEVMDAFNGSLSVVLDCFVTSSLVVSD